MKLFFFMFMFFLSGCSNAEEDKKQLKTSETCDFSFNLTQPCVYQNISVNFVIKNIADDEKSLHRLNVVHQKNKYTLKLTKNTSMLEGDKGYISFADINFDTAPDLAITTSFGLANLYIDYWVYDTKNKKYVYVGNFSKLKINYKDKTLSNVVKISAAKYKNTTYTWRGFKLVKK